MRETDPEAKLVYSGQAALSADFAHAALDAVEAIVDSSYFDWPILPETPSSLEANAEGESVKLAWQTHSRDATVVAVERRAGNQGRWERIARLPASAEEYEDRRLTKVPSNSYRVRALNDGLPEARVRKFTLAYYKQDRPPRYRPRNCKSHSE